MGDIRYLKLTDLDNRGKVVKQEGRMFFRNENGEWVRTGMGVGYFYPDAPEFDCYEVITEDEAMKLVNVN